MAEETKPLSERVREFLPRILAGTFCDHDIEEWPDKIAKLEATNQAAHEKCEALDAEIGEARDLIAELEAENKRLREVPMKYTRMAFNAELQAENAALHHECERLREANIRAEEQIAELRKLVADKLTEESQRMGLYDEQEEG